MSTRIEKRFRNFISNNLELVSEYESSEFSIPLECCVNEVIKCFENLSKVNSGSDFNKTLKFALESSLEISHTYIKGSRIHQILKSFPI